MNPRLRTALVWFVLLAVLAGVVWLGSADQYATRTYETLATDVTNQQVSAVEIDGEDLIVHAGAQDYRVKDVAQDDVLSWLDENNVPVRFHPSAANPILAVLLGLAVIGGVIYFLRRRQLGAGGAGGGTTIFDMRRSNARKLTPGVEHTRFADVGGHAEAKEVLADVVDFLKNPARWTSAGVRLPRGVLLEGPPGGGKTLLARAVAGEAGVPVFVISASEFVEMFVGVGAARIRDLFETAKKSAPAVVFIDEIDAVGRRRGSGLGTAHDEREQTLNQLLVCLDGFEPSTRIVVIAATNRSDVLDRALLRPGRFDLRLSLGFPDLEARADILRIHCRSKRMEPGIDLRAIAALTPGVSGAMLEHLCNEAGIRAVRRSRRESVEAIIQTADFTAAVETAAKVERKFDALDALFVESTSQFTQPTGEVYARLTLTDGVIAEGRVLWADSGYVKLQPTPSELGETEGARLIPKGQIRAVEALPGTSLAAEIRPDGWALRRTETA